MEVLKLLIVDDHPVLREGLCAYLRAGHPEAEILQAASADEGFQIADADPDLDIVVLDLKMPGVRGPSAVTEFGRRRPDLPIIVLSSSEDAADVREVLASGALGYVCKSASQQTLLTAIDVVLRGELYIPPLMLDGSPPSSQAPVVPEFWGLTPRQREVLRLVREGRSNKQIAMSLALSENTVKVHVTAVFKALGVVNRTEAAFVARERGARA